MSPISRAVCCTPEREVDAAGIATDWPGWKFENGQWVVDPSDAHLRDGLRVVVEVNPTSEGTVSYPPATSACADPAQGAPDDAAADLVPPTTVPPAVQPPVPLLPPTGSNSTRPVRARSVRPGRGRRPDTAARPPAPPLVNVRVDRRHTGDRRSLIGARCARDLPRPVPGRRRRQSSHPAGARGSGM